MREPAQRGMKGPRKPATKTARNGVCGPISYHGSRKQLKVNQMALKSCETRYSGSLDAYLSANNNTTPPEGSFILYLPSPVDDQRSGGIASRLGPGGLPPFGPLT